MMINAARPQSFPACCHIRCRHTYDHQPFNALGRGRELSYADNYSIHVATMLAHAMRVSIDDYQMKQLDYYE